MGEQWISHKINIWHPGQLEKSKSWELFWNYQLIRYKTQVIACLITILKALIFTVYLSRKRSGQFDLQRLSALELTLFADLGRKESIIKPSFGSVMEPIYYTES